MNLHKSKAASNLSVEGDCGTVEIADFVRCVHCSAHFLWSRRSKKTAGWCGNCNGFHCPTARCEECVPFEEKLDLYEAGKIPVLV